MKISDWILEQDISTASCDDIELAQCFAEMEVLSALMECYAKQELIQEYCSGDIREFDIYMESGDEADAEPEEGSSESSDDSGDKKSNKFKGFMSGAGNKAKGAGSRVKETAKKWWGSVIDLIKNIGTLIVKLFSGVSYEQIKTKITNSTATQWDLPVEVDLMRDALHEILKKYTEFSDLLMNKSADIESYKSLYDSLTLLEENYARRISPSKEYNGRSGNLSKDDMIDFIDDMIYIQKNGVPKVKKILKDLDYAKKDYKEMENTGEMVKLIKSCAAKLHHNFTSINTTALQVTNKLVKEINKAEGRKQKNAAKADKKNNKNTSDDN